MIDPAAYDHAVALAATPSSALHHHAYATGSTSSDNHSTSSGGGLLSAPISPPLPSRSRASRVMSGWRSSAGPSRSGSGNSTPRAPAHPRYSVAPSVAARQSSYAASVSLSKHTSALYEKYNLQADPGRWEDNAELDDALHDPKAQEPLRMRVIFSSRGFRNLGCLTITVLALLALFLGYPLTQYFTDPTYGTFLFGTSGNINLNSSKQVPDIGNHGLIDWDTPQDAYEIDSFHDPGTRLQLVFSDEFEMNGRSFYPGDDPYWEALDLHYWATNNLEWYDPSAITTRSGALEINLTYVDDITQNHNLHYKGGIMTTWNKFCYRGGLLLANVMLPGATNVFGLWPAIWTIGATLDGTWPYSYDSCDVGTLPNQTTPDGSGPAAALNTGPDGGSLSYQPGQRLSRCTCPGESHPGPVHDDGTFVGRSAPEIDVFEAQIGGSPSARLGQVSQSAQWAPFNPNYEWYNTSENMVVKSFDISHQNSWSGGVYQATTSVVSTTNQDCYQLAKGCYATQGFEYVPGYDGAYITWITNNAVSWTLNAAGVGADSRTGIAARSITNEPLYLLINLGISHAFGFVDTSHLTFPATMRVDWVRVYQHPDRINIGCDPADMPTSAYINTYMEAYTNPNLTVWEDDFHQPWPKNKLMGDC
ncbi:GH16 domain-containing protein [Mycena kentingensis (nom. inval.)]|nr:GH16 domain-containing protein [Mycena kentingensis (nom. inval.)]